jgi:hypothetical protein
MRQRAYKMIALAGMLALSAAGQIAGCGESLESIHGRLGGCPDSLDDGDPCTVDSCEGKEAVHTVVADDAVCALGSNAGKCQSGSCELDCITNSTPCNCTSPTDCPAAKECESWSCPSSVCTPDYHQGMPIAMQTAGDCKEVVCDGMGDTTERNDHTDVPLDDGNVCTIEGCDMGMSSPTNEPEGTVCPTGFCAASGTCVPCVEDDNCGAPPMYCDNFTCASCANNMKDGDEDDVDCGGMHCKACNGSSCMTGDQCKSTFCVDGVCCDAPCNMDCQACNVPGSPGTCSTVSQYSPDTCAPLHECNPAGECKLGANQPCTNLLECASLNCVGQLCKNPDGAPCANNMECKSSKCVGNVCVP